MGPESISGTQRLTTAALLLGALLSGMACASAGGSPGGAGSTDEITRAQIDANPSFTTADQLIRQMHPRWLRPSRTTTGGPLSVGGGTQEPVVFLDGVRLGGLASLGGIALSGVERIQFVDARDATTLYGTGFQAGVIEVTSRSRSN